MYAFSSLKASDLFLLPPHLTAGLWNKEKETQWQINSHIYNLLFLSDLQGPPINVEPVLRQLLRGRKASEVALGGCGLHSVELPPLLWGPGVRGQTAQPLGQVCLQVLPSTAAAGSGGNVSTQWYNRPPCNWGRNSSHTFVTSMATPSGKFRWIYSK